MLQQKKGWGKNVIVMYTCKYNLIPLLYSGKIKKKRLYCNPKDDIFYKTTLTERKLNSSYQTFRNKGNFPYPICRGRKGGIKGICI